MFKHAKVIQTSCESRFFNHPRADASRPLSCSTSSSILLSSGLHEPQNTVITIALDLRPFDVLSPRSAPLDAPVGQLFVHPLSLFGAQLWALERLLRPMLAFIARFVDVLPLSTELSTTLYCYSLWSVFKCRRHHVDPFVLTV